MRKKSSYSDSLKRKPSYVWRKRVDENRTRDRRHDEYFRRLICMECQQLYEMTIKKMSQYASFLSCENWKINFPYKIECHFLLTEMR